MFAAHFGMYETVRFPLGLFIPRPLDPALHALGIAQNRFLRADEGKRTARALKIALSAFLAVLKGGIKWG